MRELLILIVMLLAGCYSSEGLFDPTTTPTDSPLIDVVEQSIPAVAYIQSDEGSGTGFFYSEHGMLYTNAHVVGNTKEVAVNMHDGKRYRGDVCWTEPELDVAMIMIPRYYPSPYIETKSTGNARGESVELTRVGEAVVALGFPYGQEVSVSRGIVSNIHPDKIQTDASLNPGNSGGPLINLRGEVIGIVYSRLERSEDGRDVQGIGFAIPIGNVTAVSVFNTLDLAMEGEGCFKAES